MHRGIGYYVDTLLKTVVDCEIQDFTEDCVWTELADGLKAMIVPENIFYE